MAELIVVTCPHCQKQLKAPSDRIGRTAKCPQCQQSFALGGGAAPSGSASGVAVAAAASGVGKPATPVTPPAVKPTPAVTAPVSTRWTLKIPTGETYGPIERTDLDQWFSEGRINAECQLLNEGAASWQWASDVYPSLNAAATVPQVPNVAPQIGAAVSAGVTKGCGRPSRERVCQSADDELSSRSGPCGSVGTSMAERGRRLASLQMVPITRGRRIGHFDLVWLVNLVGFSTDTRVWPIPWVSDSLLQFSNGRHVFWKHRRLVGSDRNSPPRTIPAIAAHLARCLCDDFRPDFAAFHFWNCRTKFSDGFGRSRWLLHYLRLPVNHLCGVRRLCDVLAYDESVLWPQGVAKSGHDFLGTLGGGVSFSHSDFPRWVRDFGLDPIAAFCRLFRPTWAHVAAPQASHPSPAKTDLILSRPAFCRKKSYSQKFFSCTQGFPQR